MAHFVVSGARSAPKALAAVLSQQCRGAATHYSNAAAISANGRLQEMCWFGWQHLQPGSQEQQLKPLELQQPFRSSILGCQQSLGALSTHHEQQERLGLRGSMLTDGLWEQLLQQQQHPRQQQAPLPQQAQQQQQQFQQHHDRQEAAVHAVESCTSQLAGVLGLQLPPAIPGLAQEPLLCIKRTYQPHPQRYKRKHGFLKR